MAKYNSLREIQEAIRKQETSCVALVKYYLERIEENKNLNVFLEVYADEALKKATEVDEKIKNNTAGRLAGMVIGIKDVLAHQDHGLQAASRILDGFESQFTATAVQRVIDEDVIIIGRQNCDEFAMGSSNENSAFGPVRNYADPTRVPGGSSGASAVAVQADMCLASLGSDTGGSVRQPAAFCGVIGVKPTYSRVSRWGLIAYASSFDCVGPITRDVNDAALLLEIIAGADEYDSTVSSRPVPAFTKQLSPKKHYRIAYMREALESEGLDEDVKQRTFETINWLKDQGHVVEAVDYPLLKYLLPTYYILTTAEASSNLSRFDGVKYGFRAGSKIDNLESLYKKTRAAGFGAEVRKRIILGTFVLSADYYDAYYTKAQRVRRLIKESTDKILSAYDFLISPTTPTPPFKIGEKSEDQLQMFLADIFTVQANVIGNPCVSIPNGQSSDGLPIGIQVLGKNFEESEMLAFAKFLQQQ
ncbi:Asp-tRNA(Asn)/Glu-tRNA(Gln) amidotransferase subunit GatA [Emticicia sp. TH156]|uniref:Asp-tRNA(Asn)/Glu-tRNA(Gln) amidotransferase subunit GatA n=1 Tax=Emticicia sp. TH156 TaxID=2067454 RepID=UPI000C7636A0|nr:Asp-tRNA(Asn)/Glu-tRNA(Gln) amidotransferase subunit GatA [Emticicia sp. TH156]PLK44769.1 Asp-tRNA(Asn)/Glu-tRNA(Gln) amidotransferase GatCAB subunit A [Emticicia sp. TH156]